MFLMGAINAFWDGLIKQGSQSGMNEVEFLEEELRRWLTSKKRADMLTGMAYYGDRQDIERKERMMIGPDGGRVPVHNLPNFKIMDNQYGILVDQKNNYLLGKPVELKTEGQDDRYTAELDKVFDYEYAETLQATGENALNCGISWQFVYIDTEGQLRVRMLRGDRVLAFWRDDEHKQLDAALYVYPVTVYRGRTPDTVIKCEYYTTNGVRYFVFDNDKLLPDNDKTDAAYMTVEGKPMNWSRVPLIAFKRDRHEQPLICKVKCLQDALNQLTSWFADTTSEDIRSTILVLYNYDGEKLSDFRRNLMAYGAIKIRRDDGQNGGVEALHIEVNPQNFELIQKLLKRAIIENGRGFDAKDERFTSGYANKMNIQAAYSDIDLDANQMEVQFKASLRRLMWFVNTYLQNIKGVAPTSDVTFVFNRDMLTNESETINNCRNSVGIISNETIVANHPWTEDTQQELERLKKEKQEAMDDLMGGDYAAPPGPGKPPQGE